jgi:hypothetical protein
MEFYGAGRVPSPRRSIFVGRNDLDGEVAENMKKVGRFWDTM